MEALMFENELADRLFPRHPGSCDDDMLQGAASARKLANNMICKESATPDGILAVKVLTNKAPVLTSLDKFFRLEIAFLQAMHGEAGEAKFKSQLIKCLPTEATAPTATTMDCLQRVNAIIASPLYHFCSTQGKGHATALREMVTALHIGQRPKLDVANSPWMAKVGHGLAYFASTTEHADGTGRIVVGHPAIDLLFNRAKAVVDARELRDQSTLEFGRFRGLLIERRFKSLQTWTKMLVTSVDVAVEPPSMAQTQEEKRKAEAKSKAQQQHQSNTDDLFA